jgi:hypothetical protein
MWDAFRMSDYNPTFQPQNDFELVILNRSYIPFHIKYCNSVCLLNDTTYTALVACTGRHHLIDVVHIPLLSFVQDGTIEFM